VSDGAGAKPIDATPETAEKVQESGGNPFLRRYRMPIMIGAPLLVVAGVAYLALTGGRYVSTDNAYIRADRVAISPSVSGRVVTLKVHENDVVKKGDVLVTLDPVDYDAAEKQAEAAVSAARLKVASLRAQYEQRVIDMNNAVREAARQKDLKIAGVSSEAEVDKAQHDADASRQAVAAALAGLGGSAHLSADAHPDVQEARARLALARSHLNDTRVLAPQDGVVTKVDQVQIGAVVNTAQPMFWLVSGKPWVEANFKEDQLKNMRLGQKAVVKIEAFGGTEIHAHLRSFSPGTGASFSLLPPENATGNWVKVTQRVPVQFELDDAPADLPMIAGLSAKVTVDTKTTPAHAPPPTETAAAAP
jgi:membrane fusion protein (multidrug efflux system)